MGAARRFRAQTVAEDAGDDCEVFAFYPEDPVDDDDAWDLWAPEHDALAHTVDPRYVWPDWICGECGTHHDGEHVACVYCGATRDDVDQCT